MDGGSSGGLGWMRDDEKERREMYYLTLCLRVGEWRIRERNEGEILILLVLEFFKGGTFL